MEVKPVTAGQTHALRLKVLRPGGALEHVQWPNDTAPSAFHLGAFAGDHIICVASFYREPIPGTTGTRNFRLRGMATDPAHRRQGAGRELMKHALARLRSEGCDVLWCNARVNALGFYEELGFQRHGDLFDIPGIGGHYLMSIDL